MIALGAYGALLSSALAVVYVGGRHRTGGSRIYGALLSIGFIFSCWLLLKGMHQ